MFKLLSLRMNVTDDFLCRVPFIYNVTRLIRETYNHFLFVESFPGFIETKKQNSLKKSTRPPPPPEI